MLTLRVNEKLNALFPCNEKLNERKKWCIKNEELAFEIEGIDGSNFEVVSFFVSNESTLKFRIGCVKNGVCSRRMENFKILNA